MINGNHSNNDSKLTMIVTNTSKSFVLDIFLGVHFSYFNLCFAFKIIQLILVSTFVAAFISLENQEPWTKVSFDMFDIFSSTSVIYLRNCPI